MLPEVLIIPESKIRAVMAPAAFFTRQRRTRYQQCQRMQISQFTSRAPRLLLSRYFHRLQLLDSLRQFFSPSHNPHLTPHHVSNFPLPPATPKCLSSRLSPAFL